MTIYSRKTLFHKPFCLRNPTSYSDPTHLILRNYHKPDELLFIWAVNIYPLHKSKFHYGSKHKYISFLSKHIQYEIKQYNADKEFN